MLLAQHSVKDTVSYAQCGMAASGALTPEALGLQLLATHDTRWSPDAAHGFKVVLNLALDGCIVPTADGKLHTAMVGTHVGLQW